MPFKSGRFPFYILIIFGFVTSCHKESDNILNNSIPVRIRSVNNYIYSNMKSYYLWTDHIPTGLDPNAESDPKVFFNKLLYKTDDKWSYITNDYQALSNSFQGIDKSFGHHFKLFKEQSSENVFGIVEYVIPGSPADSVGIKRGDIFNSINDTQLDTSNYVDLLFGTDSYKVGFADLVNGEVIPNGNSANLIAVSLQEDPVFYRNVYDVGGEKIGYLVYNQFISNYNDELRNAFIDFKAAGINDLILDFRYNPGGSVSTAQIMASMIAPASDVSLQKVFARYIWNNSINASIVKSEGADSKNLILKLLPAELTGNLDLHRVFVITTGNTASASELIINALKPYMQVVTLGYSTAGKYTASITFHDDTKSYNWAIQPIVVKLANANNASDYKDGFSPDYPVSDDYFSALGSLNEGMFSKAVSVITGIPVDQLARKMHNPVPEDIVPVAVPSGNPVREHHLMILENLPD